MNLTTDSELLYAKWYWVTDGQLAWPAMHDPMCAGGWTNNDTWEDFDRVVVAWKELPDPEF